ncbi:Ger(x)C family spore germination protein [Gottfriedia acidiceleris]|uniref:Ger(x)C family spore germination protein n=1 Tax=Gottfriedia acidiceleris TaxID=371036 RepID=UPI00101E0335|nr:Ger(x)C family spore germination protein [Gottfriedia acidiceleris]
MKYKIVLISLICLLPLTSCWDQRLLKESRLVYSAGYDLTEDNNMLVTAVIKSTSQGGSDPSQVKSTNVFINATGKTSGDARLKVTRKVSGDYATNKTRVLLLGNELAKQNIYPIFDIVYRDPRSSLGAKVILAKGRAEEILKLNKVEETLVSEEILDLITTAESHTIVPIENVQTICTIMFDPGEDIVLPLIEKVDEKLIDISGLALFNDQKYTGYNLLDDEPTMLLLFKNQLKKFARFNVEVSPKEKDIRERYISIEVRKNDPKMKIEVSKENKISVNLNLKLEVDTLEYAHDELDSKKEIEKLNKALSKQLTKKAEKVIKTVQESNCDALGIGRQLISFHPDVWKKLDWNKDYAKITIKPKVEVKIVGSGILK